VKPLSRRELLYRAATGTGAVLLTPAGVSSGAPLRPFRGGRFEGGVLSGDPTPHGITLLTRLAGVEGTGGVMLEVARDPGFRKVLGRSVLRTSDAVDHAVKARLGGLKPHRRYWYRFATKTAHSRVGHFRTAPPRDSREPVRFGVFACQDYTNGYFNAHAALAREDLDFVLCLGDYIYADVAHTGDDAVRALRDAGPAHTLAEYRGRYQAYRADRDLQHMHASHAMVSTWDDGEVATGYAGRPGDGEYALPPAPMGPAYRAWFEAMPHYPPRREETRVYGKRVFGRTLDLMLLDTRQYRVSPPCDNDGDPACPELDQPREILGGKQTAYFADQLDASEARWRIVASPSPVTPFLTAPDRYHGFDSWQGYPLARSKLLEVLSGLRGATVLSANLRRFIAANLFDDRGAPLASEFVCGSVSAGLDAETGDDRRRILDANPGFVHYDSSHHGYVTCTTRRDDLSVRFHKMRTVRDHVRGQGEGAHFALRRSTPFFD
jgi:alkaline phosphatase D